MSRRRKGDEPTGVEMAITPMLDMTFQLLFFFILNYNPGALEGQLAMSLPMKAENAAKDQSQVETTNNADSPELPAELSVEVSAQHAGNGSSTISEIKVVDRAGPNKDPIRTLDELRTYLVSRREGLTTNKDDVSIVADSRLKWADVVQVVDACKKAGYNIGFAEPPDYGVNGQ
jgi:biopolymer transport protein ExbD